MEDVVVLLVSGERDTQAKNHPCYSHAERQILHDERLQKTCFKLDFKLLHYLSLKSELGMDSSG